MSLFQVYLRTFLFYLLFSFPVLANVDLLGNELGGISELSENQAQVYLAHSTAGQVTINQQGGQVGNPNQAFVGQTGYGNEATINQTGSGNTAKVVQLGVKNDANIKQDGFDNTALIVQSGLFNSATIEQSGNGNNAYIGQVGLGQDEYLSQTGGENTFAFVDKKGVSYSGYNVQQTGGETLLILNGMNATFNVY
ncbi:MAG: hypothetical protein ACPHV3_00735 [Vibrio sp.]